MKLVECAHCGSKELIEEQGYVICTYCRSRFLPGPDEVPPRETVIGLESDIQTLLQQCRNDPSNSQRIANLILDIDPTNAEARKYLL